MLVLSRKKNESIIINGNIEIKIIETEDGKVKIGIEAPRNIPIHRKEVFDLIAEQNKAASTSNVKLDGLKGTKLPTLKDYKKKVNIKNDKLL